MSAERSTLASGTLVAGKLRVVRSLGVGGMGAVYEVEHQLTRHRRALKLLHPEVAREQEAVTRFLREASAAGRIGSDHIVQTFDAGVLDTGEPYLVMELLEGQSLGDILDQRGTLSEREARDWIAQACDGLQAAHEAGIVHRDIKPDNLFIERSGRVKILDFGISKFDSALTGELQLTRDNLAMGTPYYMAPELTTAANRADARVDVYALGVVLYEAVTGQKPFVADTFPQLVIRIHQGNYAPASSVSATSHLLDRIIARAMARDPHERFETPRALALALRDLDQATERAPAAHSAEPAPGAAGFMPFAATPWAGAGADPNSPTVRFVEPEASRVGAPPNESGAGSVGASTPPRSLEPTLLSAGSEPPRASAQRAVPRSTRKASAFLAALLLAGLALGWTWWRAQQVGGGASLSAARGSVEVLPQGAPPATLITPAQALPPRPGSVELSAPASSLSAPAASSNAAGRIVPHSPVNNDKSSSRAAQHQLDQANPFQ